MSFFTLLALVPVVDAQELWSADWSLGVDTALHLSWGNSFHAMNSDGSEKWTFDAQFPIRTYIEGLNGTIHIIAQPNQPAHENMTHYALDGTDGSIRWQRTSLCTSVDADRTRLLTSDSSLYFFCGIGSQAKAIEAINSDGSRKWVELLPKDAIFADAGPGGGVLVENYSNEGVSVFALQPEDGAVKWTWKTQHQHPYEFGGWTLSNGNISVVVYREGAIDTVDLIHLNGEDGSIIWKVSHKAGTVSTRWTDHTYWPISGCNGEVYVYSGTGRGLQELDLVAFDLDGNILRTLPCRSGCKRSIQQNNDGTEEDIFVSPAAFDHRSDSSSGTNVVAYSGITGQMLWNTFIEGDGNVGYLGPHGTVFVNVGESDSAPSGYIGMPNAMVAIRHGFEVWRAPFTKALMAKDGTTYLQNFTHHFDGHSDTRSLSIVAEDMHGFKKWSVPISDPALAGLDSRTSFLV